MKLVPLLAFQGYKLYINNFYYSLSVDLKKLGVTAISMFRSNMHGLPSEALSLKSAMKKAKNHVVQGTMYVTIKLILSIVPGKTLKWYL